MGKKKAGAKSAAGVRLPKVECCASKSKCGRCPLRMMKEGTLPEGLTVKKRRLVTLDGRKMTKKKLARVAA